MHSHNWLTKNNKKEAGHETCWHYRESPER